jgi:hypothetical protein
MHLVRMCTEPNVYVGLINFSAENSLGGVEKAPSRASRSSARRRIHISGFDIKFYAQHVVLVP